MTSDAIVPLHALRGLGLATVLSLLTSTGCSSRNVEVDPVVSVPGSVAEAPVVAPPAADPGDAASSGDTKAPSTAEPVRAKLDATTTFQTWEGTGTSLAAWSTEAREQYRSEQWQRLYLDDMGMTVLRVDLLPTPLYPDGKHATTAFRFGPDLDDNVAKLDYDRSPRAAIYGEVAQDLAARGTTDGAGAPGLRILASVWTPPHFMKDGANITNNGSDSAGGHLRMDRNNVAQYARYLAAAVTAWERRFGLPIYALSIQNEPRFEQPYSSMAISPADYATVLAEVKAELSRQGMATRLFGPEDVGYGPEGDHSRIDAQLSFIRAVMEHPQASSAMDAFAIHGYGGDGIDSRGYVAPGNWKYYWSNIEQYGRPTWQTESGGGPPQGMGPVYFANVIFEGMSYGQISLWCNWMFSQAKPLDQHSLVGFDLNTDQPKYAVAKHFFRYIRPGARRLAVEPFDVDGVRLVAWQAPEGGPLTMVLINLRDQAAPVELDLAEAGRDRLLRRYQTSVAGSFVELAALRVDGPVRLQLPPTSLTTLSDVK